MYIGVGIKVRVHLAHGQTFGDHQHTLVIVIDTLVVVVIVIGCVITTATVGKRKLTAVVVFF